MEPKSRGRFEDLELLGRGGMGAVFRARDSANGRSVALKALQLAPDERHREQLIAHFHREYRTLAELDHPRVIQVFDYGADAEGPYYTMELLDGTDLSRCAPLPWRQACSLARDVCSSLALLHSRGYVHRDVSPPNVRCTSDGRAKLIDFGAMVPMGVSTLAMGTPPCVAPEALARQPLDGRTDLFALGATLYYALCGRQAYAARSFNQLRAAHASQPLPPSAYAREVPTPVDALVLSLLSLDAMARPRSAAEVMARLTAVADLGPTEPVGVQKAYLNTPALVGRAESTAQITEALVRTRGGRGEALRVWAAQGGGRSRMLQSAIMEGRLSGMWILQVSAAAEDGPYAVVRAVLRELWNEAKPAEALIKRMLLQQLLDGDPLSDDAATRKALLRELASLFNELSRGQPMLISIDDVARCDEGSLAAMVTLASVIHSGPIMLVYADGDDQSEPAPGLKLLRELSRPIALPALDERETEALLLSLFGAVPNLQIMARHVFKRALGNPRNTMELAQAIVDRRLARYELGSWSLPGHIENDAVPVSLHDVRRQKLAGLSQDALDLAQVLAISADYRVAGADLQQLTLHADAARVADARAVLLEARVIAAPDALGLIDHAWLEIVREGIDERRSRELHERLVSVLRGRAAGPIPIARCLLRAGEPARAIEDLCSALKNGSLIDEGDSEYPDLLQECAKLCVQLGRSQLERFLIARELVALSDRVIIKDRAECFRVAFQQLSLDSGLSDWATLDDGPDRLTRALTAAQARYDATPEAERVMAPLDAIRTLVETVYLGAVYAAVVGDMVMIDTLPDLAPLEPLSPAIASVTVAKLGQRALIGARYEDALALYEERLTTLEQQHAHLTEAQLARSRALLHYALGSMQAGLGIKGAFAHAQALEAMPNAQVMAAAVRESYYVRSGNTRAAAQWRRRMELLQIQQKRPYALKLRQTTQQLECSAHADDLEETKRNLEVLEELCEFYPAALPYLHYAHAECERIRGDYAAGLRHVRGALASARPAEHPVWPWAAGCEIECLRNLGRLEEAREVGLAHVSHATIAGLQVMRDHIEVFLALVEAALGYFDFARERLDRGIQYREQYGMRGLNLGWSYEARARVALWMNDRVMFERCLRSCTQNYGGGRNNPALAARHERLLLDARSRWEALPFGGLLSEGPTSFVQSASPLLTEAALARGLADCKDREARALFALEQLLAAANCDVGRLYLLRDGALEPVATRGLIREQATDLALLLTQLDDDDMVDTASEEEAAMITCVVPVHAEARSIVLTCKHGDQLATFGVLLLESTLPENSAFHSLANRLGSALIVFGDTQAQLR
ncbi:MAG TPA: protein kinase [Polyangiales bacterium]|nr:protein kinase [Polyangiales bacterium]